MSTDTTAPMEAEAGVFGVIRKKSHRAFKMISRSMIMMMTTYGACLTIAAVSTMNQETDVVL